MCKLLKSIFTSAIFVSFLGLTAITVRAGEYYDSGYSSPSDDAAAAGIAIVMLACFCIYILIVYIYMSFCLMKIAEKTGYGEQKLLAWIPVANLYLELQIAGKPTWWLILYFIPIANIIVMLMTWMGVAKTAKHPEWFGVLMLIFPLDMFVPGYIAFVEGKEQA